MTTRTATQTVVPPPAMQRAMRRAVEHGIKPLRRNARTYLVRSHSDAATSYTVTLDAHGKIGHCDCVGFAHGGMTRPCWHVGAVALARLYEMGITPVSGEAVEMPVSGPSVTRDQIMRGAA